MRAVPREAVVCKSPRPSLRTSKVSVRRESENMSAIEWAAGCSIGEGQAMVELSECEGCARWVEVATQVWPTEQKSRWIWAGESQSHGNLR